MEPRRHNRSGNHRRTREHQVEKQNKQSAPATRKVAEDNIRRNPASSTMSSLAMPALSGDDDYVRRWLAEMEQESKVDHGQPVSEQKISDHRGSFQKAQPDIQSFRHISYATEELQIAPRRKRPHNSSSDSSLLEISARPKSAPVAREDAEAAGNKRRGEPSKNYPKKWETEPPEVAPSSGSETPQETFEKRARYKTRDDLYEPQEKKNQKRSGKTGSAKRSKPRREKKGNKRKAAKKAGEDLMQNFSSKSIGQERLTMRPSHRPGLFNNGRASSPVKRRGLPDLAFSEMDFLQRSKQTSSRKREDKALPRSREKEKRKAERTHEEISNFFKPNRAPLEDISANTHRGTPSMSVSEERLVSNTHISDQRYSIEQARPESVGMSCVGSGNRVSFSDAPSAPGAFAASLQDWSNIPDTASKRSGRATSYVTWSETQFSPGATAASRRIRDSDQRHASPTPELIRRSIENTGIFRDTGIKMLNLCGPLERAPSETRDKSNHQPLNNDKRTSSRRSESSTSTGNFSSELSGSHRRHSISRDEDFTSDKIRRRQNEKREISQQIYAERDGNNSGVKVPNAPNTPQGHTRIALYYPGSGWREVEDPILVGGLRIETEKQIVTQELQEIRNTPAPASRESVAQKARIKRPSTTVPLARTAKEEAVPVKTTVEIPNQQDEEFLERREALGDVMLIDPVASGEEQSEMAPSRNEKGASVTGLAIPDLGHGLRAAQLGNSLQEQFLPVDSNSQAINRPRSTLFGNEATESSLSTTHSNVPDAETFSILNTGSESNTNNAAEMVENSFTTLPIRGSWIEPRHGTIFRNSRLSPIIEEAPLYLHQLQRNLDYEEQQAPYEKSHGKEEYEESIDSQDHEMIYYPEDIELDSWENDYAADLPQGYSHVRDVIGHRLDDPENYRNDHLAIPELWEEEYEQNVAEENMNYELWSVQEHNITRDYEMAEEIYNTLAFDQPYTITRQDPGYEEDVTGEGEIQGFWRPRRSY